LEAIAEFIGKDSPHYAASFVRQARRMARSLAFYSERGRVVPEFKNPAIRELLLGNYRLIYKVMPETVYVLGVIHGARNLEDLLLLENRGEGPATL
jgi:plasmid stabilization system protein ParE